MKKRLKTLETRSAQQCFVLIEAQIVALEKAKSKREAAGEIETHHPGYLGRQDTHFGDRMKCVGRIYQKAFVDTYSRAICHVAALMPHCDPRLKSRRS